MIWKRSCHFRSKYCKNSNGIFCRFQRIFSENSWKKISTFQCSSHFNAKIGNEKSSGVTGCYSLSKRDYRGDKFIAWAEAHDMIIAKHGLNNILEVYGHGKALEIMFAIKLTMPFRSRLWGTITRPRGDCYCDHVLVIGKLILQL